jgi:hypothetical protein
MAKSLQGCKVAVLALDGFEQAELLEPQRALAEAGATVHVISAKPGKIRGFKHVDKGDSVAVDTTFDKATAAEYDAVVLPGGVVNGDAIRSLREGRQQRAQADRRDLSWHMAAGIGGHHQRPHGDELAQPAGRYSQRGWYMGRSGSGGGRQLHHQPQTRRSASLQQNVDRATDQAQGRLRMAIALSP